MVKRPTERDGAGGFPIGGFRQFEAAVHVEPPDVNSRSRAALTVKCAGIGAALRPVLADGRQCFGPFASMAGSHGNHFYPSKYPVKV
jgi:hypothetical protein